MDRTTKGIVIFILSGFLKAAAQYTSGLASQASGINTVQQSAATAPAAPILGTAAPAQSAQWMVEHAPKAVQDTLVQPSVAAAPAGGASISRSASDYLGSAAVPAAPVPVTPVPIIMTTVPVQVTTAPAAYIPDTPVTPLISTTFLAPRPVYTNPTQPTTSLYIATAPPSAPWLATTERQTGPRSIVHAMEASTTLAVVTPAVVTPAPTITTVTTTIMVTTLTTSTFATTTRRPTTILTTIPKATSTTTTTRTSTIAATTKHKITVFTTTKHKATTSTHMATTVTTTTTLPATTVRATTMQSVTASPKINFLNAAPAVTTVTPVQSTTVAAPVVSVQAQAKQWTMSNTQMQKAARWNETHAEVKAPRTVTTTATLYWQAHTARQAVSTIPYLPGYTTAPSPHTAATSSLAPRPPSLGNIINATTTSFNATALDVSWSHESYSMAATVAFCGVALSILSIIGALSQIRAASFSTLCSASSKTYYQALPDGSGSDGQVGSGWGERLRVVCITQTMLNKICVLFGLVVTIACHAPSWILVLALPFLLWARHLEYNLLTVFGGTIRFGKDGWSFLFGAILLLNDFCDGVVVAKMYLADSAVHRQFVESFQESLWPAVRHFAPVADYVHLWVFAIALHVICHLLQLFVAGMWSSYMHPQLKPFSSIEMASGARKHHVLGAFATATEAAGMSALASRMDGLAPYNARRSRMLWMYAGRVLLQNSVQVSIVTSFLTFLSGGKPLYNLSQPIILLDAGLSLFCMTKKGFELISFTRRECKEREPFKTCGPVALALALFVLILVAWNVAKLVDLPFLDDLGLYHGGR